MRQRWAEDVESRVRRLLCRRRLARAAKKETEGHALGESATVIDGCARSQVRSGLAAGGEWIQTVSSAMPRNRQQRGRLPAAVNDDSSRRRNSSVGLPRPTTARMIPPRRRPTGPNSAKARNRSLSVRNWKFESFPLQQRVCELSVPRSGHVHDCWRRLRFPEATSLTAVKEEACSRSRRYRSRRTGC